MDLVTDSRTRVIAQEQKSAHPSIHHISSTLHDGNIQEFDTRCDEVLLSMSKIPSDDILESLYKFTMRESVQFKTVMDSYDKERIRRSMLNYQKIEDIGEEEFR